MKKIFAIVIGVVVLAGIVGLTWWAAGTSSPRPKPDPAGSKTPTTVTQAPGPLPTLPGSLPNLPGSPIDPSAPPAGSPGSPSSKGMDPEVFAERLHQVLINDAISHDQAAATLLDMLPAGDAEQQVELSQHAANLLSDEQYGRIRNLLLDPKVDAEVKEVWYSDMLNRDPLINVPLLADVAKQKDNPFQQEAIDTLSIILNPDIADNQGLIDTEVKRYIDELKQEEADAPPAAPPEN
jgi:hypothetical protein